MDRFIARGDAYMKVGAGEFTHLQHFHRAEDVRDLVARLGIAIGALADIAEADLPAADLRAKAKRIAERLGGFEPRASVNGGESR